MAKRRRGAPKKYSKRMESRIVRMRDRGLSWLTIQLRTGVPRNTAKRIVEETPRIYLEEHVEKVARRCPGCRRKVVLPCLACELDGIQ